MSVRRHLLTLSLALSAVLSATTLTAQPRHPGCQTNTLIVFDASGSMSLMSDGTSRIDTARRAMIEVLPEITAGRRAGLMTYSGISNLEPPQRCGSIRLRVPLTTRAAPAILDAMLEIQPAGLTPLTAAVEQAAEELKYRTEPGIIVLVTDGLETCNRSPCALARQLKATAKDLVVHVVGYFLGPEQAVHVACLADETGGLYVPARSFDEMRDALRAVMRCREIS
jgi:Ca-activated chloride channel homolog